MGLNEDNMSRFAKLQLFIFRNNRTTVELGKYTELQRVCNGFDSNVTRDKKIK